MNFLNDVVADNFDFYIVSEMPSDFEVMQNKSKLIMKLSRPALDLNEYDERFIINIDNFDWDSGRWSHFCLGAERCLAKCGGNPTRALELMQQAVALAVGRVPAAPLGHRWKGVDEFLAKLYRGLRYHSAWLTTHRLLYPADKVKKRMRNWRGHPWRKLALSIMTRSDSRRK